MSDTVILAVITLLGTMFNSYMIYLGNKKSDTIHKLVNSNMTTQLKISAAALRRVAEFSNTDADTAAANLAEDALVGRESK